MFFLIDRRIRRLYERLRFNFKIQYIYNPAPCKVTCEEGKRTMFKKLQKNREHNVKANLMFFMA